MTTCPNCGRPHWGLSCTLCTPESSMEKLRAKAKRWRRKNRERVRAWEKLRRERDKAKRAEQMRAWKAANPEKMKEYRKRWVEKNPDKVREMHRAWDKVKRSREALAALAEAKAKPSKLSPKISALLELAKVKAQQASYGIQRVSFQERR